MPVTAKLSRSFYDRFGDEIANELVEWFNSVDLTYRADLRELNEINFARFDAKMEERLGRLEAHIDALQVTEQFTRIDEHFARVDQRFASLESLLREHMSASDVRTAQFEARMSQFEARMMRWMLTFWVGTLGGLAALVWAMVRAR